MVRLGLRVRVRVSLGVRVSGMSTVSVNVWVRVMVSNLLGSDYGQGEFRVIIRVNAKLQLGVGSMFNPNNLLTLTIATQLTLTLPLNPNLPN